MFKIIRSNMNIPDETNLYTRWHCVIAGDGKWHEKSHGQALGIRRVAVQKR